MLRPRLLPILVLLCGLAGCGRDAPPITDGAVPPEDVGVAVGKIAPDITGEDVQGNQLRLRDYRGKVVVLEFWSTT